MDNKLELFFVRHGETEWNREGRLQGWLDSPLTSNGIRQINRLKEQLKDVRFDAAFSSTSERAFHTAQLLVGNNFTIKKDARLMEIHLGSWQGKRIVDIETFDAERYAHYCHQPEKYIPDTGESFQQVIQRMNNFLEYCESSFSKGKILVVSHGVAIRALILSIMQLSINNIWDFEIDGASVTKIVTNGKQRIIEYIGKTDFLE